MRTGVDQHVPVLLEEVVCCLAIRADGVYVDGTFGRGGHSKAILAALGPQGRVLALDRDPEAVGEGLKIVRGEPRLTVEQGNFGDLEGLLTEHRVFGQVDGILLDLGVSGPQLEDAQRGFSFQAAGPLDMRMNPESSPSAAEWINTADEGEIARVLRRFGEERAAGRIARRICNERDREAITTTARLAEIVEQVKPRHGSGKHPATLTFQAIRIFINRELDELQAFLDLAIDALAVGGRLCVISFHSLEDRMVKRFIRNQSRVDPALASLPVVPDSAQPRLRSVDSAIRPGEAEVLRNPRARSAVLRVAERVR